MLWPGGDRDSRDGWQQSFASGKVSCFKGKSTFFSRQGTEILSKSHLRKILQDEIHWSRRASFIHWLQSDLKFGPYIWSRWTPHLHRRALPQSIHTVHGVPLAQACLSDKDTSLSSQAMFQNGLLMLPYPPTHRTESGLKRPFQKSSLAYHSAWTGASREGLLQLSSCAGGESKVGRLHLTSQHIWQGSVKRMKKGNILSMPVCVHGNSGYKQVIYPPQASCGN